MCNNRPGLRIVLLRTVLLSAVAAMTFLAACGGGDAEPGADSQAAIPDWIVNVRPEPGVESSTLKLVEVEHEVQTGGRDVRLIVDGVDVTASSDFGAEQRVSGPGHILYDPERRPQSADAPVTLDAGQHTATAELVELDEVGGGEEVVDSFTWTFSIQ